MPPTPLSPDFDPLTTSCDLAALSGFGGSLRPCCPKAAPGFAGCSVRIVLRRSSLRTVPVELPEDTSSFTDRSTPQVRKPLESRALLGSDRLATAFASRRSGRTTRGQVVHPGSRPSQRPKASGIPHFAPFGSSCDVPRFATVSAEPPEGISPVPACAARPARKPPWRRSRSVRFDPKAHQNVPGSVVGAGRDHPKSLSIPGHRRPTKIHAEASIFVFVASLPFPSPRLPGSMSGVPLQPMVIPPKGFLSMFGRQMHGPAVALSRSIRTQQRCRPYLETAFLPSRAGRTFRRSSP